MNNINDIKKNIPIIRIQQRHDTSNKWSEKNPILNEGEIVYESDTKRIKIGDGKTKYTELSYFAREEKEFDKVKEEVEKIKHDMYILFALSYISPIIYILLIAIFLIIFGNII